MIWNSSRELPNLPDLLEVSHLLRFGTSLTRARGQDDVSSKQLPQIMYDIINMHIYDIVYCIIYDIVFIL